MTATVGVSDPVTIEVIRNGLVSAAREMGITLLRTSYSPVLNEGKDFSTAIFDGQGQMVAQMEGCPIHMASMGFAVRALFEHLGDQTMEPGDVFILNDPHRGGMQHQDVTLLEPVFVDGELIMFLGVRAHHADIGGMAVGSFPGNATEQFQEGLIIPPIKYVQGGQLRTDIQELILSNVRFRESSLGDLQASHAALEVGKRSVLRLVERYGPETMAGAIEHSLNYSEQMVRQSIEKLPDGVYSFVDYVDDDGVTEESIRIEATVEVSGDEMVIDFEGTSPQVAGPLNITYSLTCSGVGIALLMVSDPDIPANDGCLRPVTVKVPEGSALNARHPAPTCGGSADTTTRVIDVLLGALSEALPKRIAAGEFGSVCFTNTSGYYPNDGDRFIMALTPAGGWGGTHDRDGWTTTDEPIGNCRNQPVEYLERRYPVVVEEYSLDPATSGPGRKRGGHGHVLRFVFLTEQVLNTMGTRSKYPPFGLFGGRQGATSAFILNEGGNVTRLRSKNINRILSSGSRLTINTGGGGGYGDPFDREVEEVVTDWRRGFVTTEEAATLYGVAIDPGSKSANLAETERLRAARPAPSDGLLREPGDGGMRIPTWITDLGSRATLPDPIIAQAREAWSTGSL